MVDQFTIRPCAGFDTRGQVYEGWEAVTPEPRIIAWGPDKAALTAVLLVLNPGATVCNESS
jgi:hypothetical protein